MGVGRWGRRPLLALCGLLVGALAAGGRRRLPLRLLSGEQRLVLRSGLLADLALQHMNHLASAAKAAPADARRRALDEEVLRALAPVEPSAKRFK